jgi:hypothetical protein
VAKTNSSFRTQAASALLDALKLVTLGYRLYRKTTDCTFLGTWYDHVAMPKQKRKEQQPKPKAKKPQVEKVKKTSTEKLAGW